MDNEKTQPLEREKDNSMDTSRYIERTYIGSGGMASVYKAVDRTLQRDVAIKEMSDQFRDNETVRSLFLNEARKMAAVKHPNVVQVYDVHDGKIPTIVMEYMGGGSLATQIGAGSLPAVEVLRIVRQVATGLQAIHESGLIHRDVKPENILEEGGSFKITDFGVAMSGDEDALPFVTNKYAAPEVLIEPTEIGRSSDIYSLGVMAIQLLLGPRNFELAVREAIAQDPKVQLPAIQDSKQAFWQQWVVSSAQLPPLNKIDESIPEELAQFLARATNRDRAERIADCGTFIEELDRVIKLGQQQESAPTEYSDKMRKRLEKSKAKQAPPEKKAKKPLWFKLTLGIAGTLLLAVTALLLWPSTPRFYFDLVTNPEGAIVSVNGAPAELSTPTRIVASWGDVVSFEMEGQDAVDVQLADGMEGLSIVDDAYQLSVTLIEPLSIESSAEAAEYLRDNLPVGWPVDASIPGIDMAGRIPLELDTALTFNVVSNEAGSLIMLYLSADNYATAIYPAPNGFSPELEAGRLRNVGEELRLVTKEPFGEEWMVFVIAEQLGEFPEIAGAIPIDNTMLAFEIAGTGSPGQALLEWVVDSLKPVNTSVTFLELEIVDSEE